MPRKIVNPRQAGSDERKRKKGLVKVSPSAWVLAEDAETAREAMKSAVEDLVQKARKLTEDKQA